MQKIYELAGAHDAPVLMHWQFGMYNRDMFEVPEMTPARVRWAYAVAAAIDIVQLALGPVGWAVTDQILDIVAMLIISRLIGFHPLLLPTFILELVPLADLLPTWTAAVPLVLAMRRHRRAVPPGDRTIIDV